MQDLLEIARLKKQLEELVQETFGTTNLNVSGALSEDSFARFMTELTGNSFVCYGGNTKGWDVRDEIDGQTYEVKSTSTTVSAYNYGNLIDKTADYAVFIKWHYGGVMDLDYCLVYPMDVVKANLNEKYNRFTSTALKRTRNQAEDLTAYFKQFIDNQR